MDKSHGPGDSGPRSPPGSPAAALPSHTTRFLEYVVAGPEHLSKRNVTRFAAYARDKFGDECANTNLRLKSIKPGAPAPYNDNFEKIRAFREARYYALAGLVQGILFTEPDASGEMRDTSDRSSGATANTPMTHIHLLRKSVLMSDLLRAEGNQAYKAKKMDKATRCYTAAGMYAPERSKQHALAYSNRSACFVEQQGNPESNAEAALADIARFESISADWTDPDDLRIVERINERKTKILRENRNASGSGNGSQSQQQSVAHHRHLVNFSTDLFRLSNPSKTIPAAEEFIGIRQDDVRGRYVCNIGASTIDPGTVVILERPFSATLLTTYMFGMEHCTECFKDLNRRGIPCAGCVFALFCSPECCAAARTSNHTTFECQASPYLFELNMNRTCQLALATLLKLPRSEVIKHYRASTSTTESPDHQDPPSTDLLPGFSRSSGMYDSSSYTPVHELVYHPSILSEQDLNTYCTDAVVITEVIRRATNYFDCTADNLDSLTAEDSRNLEIHFASLLLLHQMAFPCNAHSLYKLDIPDPTTSFLSERTIQQATYNEFGVAAFPVLSMINHSCDPNVVRVTLPNGTNGVVTIRHVHPGQEILDNYGVHFATDEPGARVSHLLNSYNFVCNCPPCRFKWVGFADLVLDKTAPQPACRVCVSKNEDHGYVIRSGWRGLSKSGSWTCKTCGLVETNVPATLDSYDEAYQHAYKELVTNNPTSAFAETRNCLKYFDGGLKKPNRFVNTSQEVLKQSLFMVSRELFR